jgi:hypothetical protein
LALVLLIEKMAVMRGADGVRLPLMEGLLEMKRAEARVKMNQLAELIAMATCYCKL